MNACSGPEHRRDRHEDLLKRAVKEAVAEALKESSLIDGPTHIAHHQAMAEALSMVSHARKTLVGAVARGLVVLFFLGCLAWVWGQRQ